ncbi:flagellar basal body P-ring formation chaperone FlgA [Alteromonas oceanisediminis]|uniref:flagellar basal body P-ring formation chaperone FlgA n=1 Tax=Alteromonas oceanisediminis TaxID=2836180 RepID=UPI001BDAA8EF|nr:flagellar basal body P-ring formation chaperone FlgA [Alteromonas oceanisediminis]MBT0584971.1 flagellar basal body P-ring formation protein FlgA [Alteromonas oceanisediminis]
MKNLSEAFFIALLATLPLALNASTLAEQATDKKAELHVAVQKGVEEYVRSQRPVDETQTLFVEAYPIDERINVAPCDVPYTYSMTESGAQQSYGTVKVTCADNNWYLFVNVKIEERQQVVVLADMVSPDTLLTQQNLTTADINSQSLRHTTFSDPSALYGARIKHRVRAGQPINPNMICFVCKGDLITLSANSAGLSISTKGIAQQDGNIGDTIRVMNSRTERTVLAKVQDHETAVVSI